jgi:hypothetical protein
LTPASEKESNIIDSTGKGSDSSKRGGYSTPTSRWPTGPDAIDSQDLSSPIRLIKKQEMFEEALWNLRYFSTEGPQYQHLLKDGVEIT